MDKLQIVQDGLSACLSLIRQGAEVVNCEECPYRQPGCDTCETLEPLLADAKELLNAAYPAPRPLTLDELRNVKPGTVLWEDIRNNPEIKDEWMPMFPVEFIGFNDFAGDETIEFSQGMDYCAEYGKSFLLWTAKPSEEQRKAVSWNG